MFRNRCGHVWIEWIKTEESQKAINYVKKYISKNAKLQFEKIPAKSRIWSTSRGLVKKPKADLLGIFENGEMGINELCSYKEFFGEIVR
jgi:hypothetical protein